MSYTDHLLDLFGLSAEDVETVPDSELASYLMLRLLGDIRLLLTEVREAQASVPPAPVVRTAAVNPTPQRVPANIGAVHNERQNKPAARPATGAIQNEKIGHPAVVGAPQGQGIHQPQAPRSHGGIGNEKIGFQTREEVMGVMRPHTVGGVVTPNQKVMPNIQNMATRGAVNIPGSQNPTGHAPAQATVQDPAVQTAPPVNQATAYTNVDGSGPQQVFTQDSQVPPVPQKTEESDGRNISFN